MYPYSLKSNIKSSKKLLLDTATQISDEAELLMDTVKEILTNHIPVHLKKYAKDMAYLRLFEDAISAPVTNLVEHKYLLPYSGNATLPTTYIILK